MCVIFCSRLVRNEVDDECWLRREMDDDLAELREDYEQTNGERVAAYEAELAEWKTYEKARVSRHAHICIRGIGMIVLRNYIICETKYIVCRDVSQLLLSTL